jgi:glutathione S-transferase
MKWACSWHNIPSEMTMTQPIRLYRFALSGHAHRVELFLSLLGLPVTLVDVDLMNGAHKKPDFLAKNPFGQVPVIQDANGHEPVTIYDSNAILVYLATRYDTARSWLPQEPVAAAKVQQWLSVAAGALFNGPSTARLGLLFKLPVDVEKAQATAGTLLQVIDAHLASHRYLVGNTPTIADVALYSYTALAPEGGIQLDAYPHVLAWLGHIESLPGFVPVQHSNLSKAG